MHFGCHKRYSAGLECMQKRVREHETYYIGATPPLPTLPAHGPSAGEAVWELVPSTVDWWPQHQRDPAPVGLTSWLGPGWPTLPAHGPSASEDVWELVSSTLDWRPQQQRDPTPVGLTSWLVGWDPDGQTGVAPHIRDNIMKSVHSRPHLP